MANKNDVKNEISVDNAENMGVEEQKKATTTEKVRKPRQTKNKKKDDEVKNVGGKSMEQSVEKFDLDAILNVKTYKKKAMSFNQDKSVAEALGARAEGAGKKTSEALNLILESIIDVENGVCRVDIDEKREEKVASTFQIDERLIKVVKSEANKRNMSVNEYLN